MDGEMQESGYVSGVCSTMSLQLEVKYLTL